MDDRCGPEGKTGGGGGVDFYSPQLEQQPPLGQKAEKTLHLVFKLSRPDKCLASKTAADWKNLQEFNLV